MTRADKTRDRSPPLLQHEARSENSLHSAVEPLAVSPATAEWMLQYGHKKVYQLMATGELESFKDGRSRRIIVASIHDLIKRRIAASAGSKPKRPA